MSESDDIDDAVEGTLRAGLMVAARIGEQLARMREQEQRSIAQAEEGRARELQNRFNASQAAARAQLEPVSRNEWWDKATPDMIERVHETAEAWKGYDPVAAGHAGAIRVQVQDRYGIDVNDSGATEQDIVSAVTRAQAARQQAENERSTAAARGDEVIVGAAVASANREDRTRSANPENPGWDTSERRNNLATALEVNNDREAVNARLVADAHQGTHPSAAVQTRPQTTPAARRTIAKGKGRTAERGGLAR
ncbi:hypothetical protein [Arthrobacter sp. CAL618]|uniref:hypothetical protein n=1 Tax=Arthrobacter sp. CAL618 TaxID=1055770 RepID=UPI00041149D9|nr:hypothetical protein [Arthrobacter sp. CAL618]